MAITTTEGEPRRVPASRPRVTEGAILQALEDAGVTLTALYQPNIVDAEGRCVWAPRVHGLKTAKGYLDKATLDELVIVLWRATGFTVQIGFLRRLLHFHCLENGKEALRLSGRTTEEIDAMGRRQTGREPRDNHIRFDFSRLLR